MKYTTIPLVAFQFALFILCLPVIATEPASRICLVDGEEIKEELYVDIVGLRLYACGEECLKKTADRGFMMRQFMKNSDFEPERIPVNRSCERTEEEPLKGMAYIEGGQFVRTGEYYVRRGAESVVGESYTVQVGSFYIDKYEVTIEGYCQFLNDGNAGYWTPWYGKIKRNEDGRFEPAQRDWAKLPVGCANHYQARGFAEWAGKRLPTEAEWEYAAGGKEGRTYPWGDDEPGETRANYGPRFGGRKPVGSFAEGRTPDGVFDLAGNIGEWCADYYDEGYYAKAPKPNPLKNPQGPENGTLRVYRVGCQCQRSTSTDLRPNSRCASSPLRSSACLGFRCVRSQD